MVKDWTDIDEPWYCIDDYPKIVLDKVSFLDILDDMGLEYWSSPAGDFTHKMRCPLPVHNFGGERTPSFFLDDKSNKFYCFGCNSRGNLIDFVRDIGSKTFDQSLGYLSGFLELEGVDLEKFNNLPKRHKTPEEKTETHVFRASVIIRDYLKSKRKSPGYIRKCRWADKQFRRLDSFLDIGDDACEEAKAYAIKLPVFLRGK